jgi:hypothetical protein
MDGERERALIRGNMVDRISECGVKGLSLKSQKRTGVHAVVST